ncbi:MAG: AmiS/UreI family transporter [Dethiobacteria bacterium]|nr:hypothetical protein [Bacillota bacterium]
MAAVVLLLASFIFAVDAAFMFGKLEPKPTAAANAVVGAVMMVIGVVIGFTAAGDPVLMIITGLTMAFSIFYLLLAWGLLCDHKLNALGWHCLMAGLFCLASSWFFFGIGDMYFGIFAIAWGILFLIAWISLVYEKPWNNLIAWLLSVECIFTLFIPAFLLLSGKW